MLIREKGKGRVKLMVHVTTLVHCSRTRILATYFLLESATSLTDLELEWEPKLPEKMPQHKQQLGLMKRRGWKMTDELQPYKGRETIAALDHQHHQCWWPMGSLIRTMNMHLLIRNQTWKQFVLSLFDAASQGCFWNFFTLAGGWGSGGGFLTLLWFPYLDGSFTCHQINHI